MTHLVLDNSTACKLKMLSQRSSVLPLITAVFQLRVEDILVLVWPYGDSYWATRTFNKQLVDRTYIFSTRNWQPAVCLMFYICWEYVGSVQVGGRWVRGTCYTWRCSHTGMSSLLLTDWYTTQHHRQYVEATPPCPSLYSVIYSSHTTRGTSF